MVGKSVIVSRPVSPTSSTMSRIFRPYSFIIILYTYLRLLSFASRALAQIQCRQGSDSSSRIPSYEDCLIACENISAPPLHLGRYAFLARPTRFVYQSCTINIITVEALRPPRHNPENEYAWAWQRVKYWAKKVTRNCFEPPNTSHFGSIAGLTVHRQRKWLVTLSISRTLEDKHVEKWNKYLMFRGRENFLLNMEIKASEEEEERKRGEGIHRSRQTKVSHVT